MNPTQPAPPRTHVALECRLPIAEAEALIELLPKLRKMVAARVIQFRCDPYAAAAGIERLADGQDFDAPEGG